ncbi:hypothetical protein [Kitasatospora sp. NPDC088351]|uniref:hypothetical protein n=1 Tax=unclassified Kitasatospora TaxID=2633591 RepID=UPI00343121A3
MICPHCDRNLLQRQRSRHRCSYCNKDFALDPKEEGPGLHDVRIRRVADRLTDGGRLFCTVEQLGYAIERRGRPEQEHRGSKGGAGCLGVLGVGALVAALALNGALIAPAALVGVGLLGLALRQVVLSDVPAPPRPITPRWRPGGFAATVVLRWKTVYGVLPAGLVEDNAVRPGPQVADPAFALLCPDRTVTTFLHANDYPRRHRALLVADPRAIPDGLPVVVLHDASPQGCLLVAGVRAARPGRRVLDAGIPVRAVLAAESRFLHLRDPDRSAELQAGPAAQVPGLTPAELAWFAEGWWSPLVAVPPKRLMSLAVRAAERVLEPPVPVALVKRPAVPERPEEPAETRRRALAVGFLTWPEPHQETTA